MAMTVLLVLATFVVFLTIEYFLGRKEAVVQEPVPAPVPRGLPGIVAGFALPENLRYHPGHTWALSESPNLVRIGFDDFAARLVGKVEKIHLPQRGQWVRQGQKVWTVARNGGVAEMVSPVEGVVTDVNEAVLRDPDLARRDPYGEGWLLAVNAPDAKTSFRNLLGGVLAREWLREAAARLRMRLEVPAAALAQDGGVAVDDLTKNLPQQKWVDLAHEFFLS
jgi:glycine cleavage system H lipoate-binding protein